MVFWLRPERDHYLGPLIACKIGVEILSVMVFLLWYIYMEGMLSTLKLIGLSFIVFVSLNMLWNFFAPRGGVLLISIVGLIAVPVLLSALIRIVRFRNST
jgi:hypothetical protein